jgi:hypothetical protein
LAASGLPKFAFGGSSVNSVWYGLAMVAVLIVVYWFVTNDKSVDETHGVLAMKPTGHTKATRKKFSLKPEP